MEDEKELTIRKAVEFVLYRNQKHTYSRATLAYVCATSDRDMRKAVAELREQGHLIVADENGGYRLATSAEDVRRYTASLRSRIVALARVVRAMESEAARQFSDFEQLPLDLAG